MTELMLIFQNDFIEKYSIRNPSHPFLEILRNSSEQSDNLHELIFQQIEFIYQHVEYTKATLLLKPVFVHVFLESSNFKHLIAEFLIEILKTELNDTIIDLVNLYFSCLKVINTILDLKHSYLI